MSFQKEEQDPGTGRQARERRTGGGGVQEPAKHYRGKGKTGKSLMERIDSVDERV